MEKDIEELKSKLHNKLDCSLFDDEMDKLKALINQLGSSGDVKAPPIIQSGPSISTKELNEIREAMKKVNEHEDKLKNLNIDSIIKRLSQLEVDMKTKADKTEISRLGSIKADKGQVDKELLNL